MKKLKVTKEKILLALIVVLSSVLNFVNLSIEGTGNAYYAAAVKSMTMSFKNFFFVSFDPSGFVSIDKPPVGFWLQAISAKIFGFSGWSIILPQALAGVISVIVLYYIVKRAFGSAAGLISALCLAITPVFVAVSRNNTIDNVLVLVLLLACWALSIAAEKGKFKYLILSMVLVGIGFNVKMLQAYMVAPALYITYLLSTATSFKKKIIHLALGTMVLIAVSLSWALIVDSVPASSRPYVDSSTNNTVMELIVGHNGAERISLGTSSKSNMGGGGQKGNGQPPTQTQNSNETTSQNSNQAMPGNPPSGSFKGGTPPSGSFEGGTPPSGNFKGGMHQGGNGGNSGNLSGTFGGQTTAGITRLFSKNILADQIVWFIPIAVLGFIAAAIKEKLKFRLDNKRKQSLVLWFMWFLPSFIYFSYNTGTFHSYYLTMLAPPIAALAGIGIVSMWEMFKEGGWKSWFLPVALIANGAAQLVMLYYFISSSYIVKILMVLLIVLCFGSSVVLAILNLLKKKNVKVIKAFTALAIIGVMITPFVGSSTVLFNSLNSSFPAAGLELLSSSEGQMSKMNNAMGSNAGMDGQSSENTKLIQFLEKNKTKNQKYLLVVSNSNSASDIIIKTGESVMAIGGFLGEDKSITLTQFKTLVKNGEIRYVMIGGQGGGQGGSSSTSEIMSWVQKNGKVVSTSEYSNSSKNNNNTTSSNTNSDTKNAGTKNAGGFGGNSEQLYDLQGVE